MIKAPSLLSATIAVAALLTTAVPARGDDEALVFAESLQTLEALASNPETGVPKDLLHRAKGIVLVPKMYSGGLVVGAKFGRGVFLVRDSKEAWGNPVIVHVAGGSLGLQAGGQETELLLLFRTKESVTRLLAGKGKFTLGIDAGVAAGPTEGKLGAETDIELRGEILSYSRSRGLFAGAAMGGARVWVDRHADSVYYGNFAPTTSQIIEGEGVDAPPEALRLKAALAALTDPPAKVAGRDKTAKVDTRVSRSSRTRRPAEAEHDDEPEPAPVVRGSTRRRTTPDDIDAPPRPAAKKARPAAPPADLDPDDAPRPARVKVVQPPVAEPNDPDDSPRPLPKP